MPRTGARTGVGLVLLGFALLALVAGAYALSGGRVGFDVGGLRVSLRNPTNPLLASVLLLAAGAGLAGRDSARRFFQTVSALLFRVSPWVAAALSVGVAVAALHFGAFVAASADASGYLSQARLWRASSLTVATPLADDLRLANGEQAFAPLGYRPARAPGAIVPTYPPGFPWMLALAAIAGLEAWVVPLAAGCVVWLTYLLGRRLGGVGAGLIGAAMAAGSPSLWYQALQPMSDVPAAFWLTLSVVLLTGASDTAALGSGLAASAAALVRPNLFLVAPLLAGSLVWRQATWPARLRTAAVFSAPVAVAAAGFMALQRALYGATTETGYGALTDLFSLAHVLPNLARYPAWVIDAHTPVILAALAAPIVARRAAGAVLPPTLATHVAWTGLLVSAVVLGFYALYLVFDGWVYVRFLLPVLPWLFALTGVALAGAARRLGGAAAIAVPVAALMLATSGIERARNTGAFWIAPGEQRFVAMADFVRGAPPDAVVLAMQHSGSLAYYTDRPVLRWDWIEPSEVGSLVERLGAQGRALYAVLEDWEEVRFTERFRGTALERLPQPLLAAGRNDAITARAYRLTGTTVPESAAPVSR